MTSKEILNWAESVANRWEGPSPLEVCAMEALKFLHSRGIMFYTTALDEEPFMTTGHLNAIISESRRLIDVFYGESEVRTFNQRTLFG